MSKEHGHVAWGGAFDAFKRMFAQLKANPEPAMVLVVAYLIVIAVKMSVAGPDYTTVESFAKVTAFDAAFFLIFMLAIPTYGLALAKGKAISVRELLRFDANKYFAILLAGILYGFAIVASFLLFIIPAIWVVSWFALYQIAVVDKGLGPIESLKESKRLVTERIGKVKVWGIIGASLVLSFAAGLLAVFPLIGNILSSSASLLISILTTAAFASLYRWAK